VSQAILIVTAGDVKIDNNKFKARFGVRIKMLSPDDVVSRVGFAIGGVCPFTVNEGVAVYLDESLRCFETVFPGSGGDTCLIEVTIPELEEYSNYDAWVDVTKPRG